MDANQVSGAIKAVAAIAEAIRELKEVPSGHLYANLTGKLSLQQYESILDILKKSELIKVDSSHLIKWVGPEI